MIRKISWIVGGLVITALAFFIPDRSGSIWPAIITSSIVGAVFTIGFAFRWIQEVKSSATRKVMILAIAIMLLGSGIYATLSYISSNQQYDRLINIRTHIEKEVLSADIHKPLLKTLQMYYTSDSENPKLDALFYAKYDSLIRDGEFQIGNYDNDDITISFYIQKAVDDTLIIAGESSVLDAKSGNFTNASGAEGNFEMHGILTPNGISYERRN